MLISSADIVDFAWVFGDFRPYVVDLTKATRNSLIGNTNAQAAAPTPAHALYLDDFVDGRGGKVGREQRTLLGHIYTLCKDQVSDPAGLCSFIARILPLYEETASKRKGTMAAHPRWEETDTVLTRQIPYSSSFRYDSSLSA